MKPATIAVAAAVLFPIGALTYHLERSSHQPEALRDSPSGAEMNADVKGVVSGLKEDASEMGSVKGAEKFSMIQFDQRVYSWRDKVYISISASQLNEDSSKIETVGGGGSGGVLMIRTGAKEIGPYRLSETGVDTGIFTGVIRLQGFKYDAGEGVASSQPSGGSGPNDGKLEVLGAEDALTASYRPRGENSNLYMRSSLIRWNIGEFAFDSAKYDTDSQPYITLNDPDRNLDPDALDTVLVRVFSDTDAVGSEVRLIEENKADGKFSQSLTLTTTGTSHGKRLRVSPGDTITVQYVDKTLPAPYKAGDALKITATASIEE